MTASLALVTSILLDQQRLQVWAWEFLWIQLFVTLATPQVAVLCCRLLVVGIYFYSAISKLDYGFIHQQGPWLWQGLGRAVGVPQTNWGSLPDWLFLGFPLGELIVSVTLILRRWRRLGIKLSILMHVTLLLALGPWGWQQRPGVLLWNLFFLSSVPVLFWRTEPATPMVPDSPTRRWRLGNEFCLLAALALGVWPAFEGLQLCDHWPAWAVYSSRPEIVRIDVHDADVPKLPASLQPYVGPAEALSEWRPVSIDQWSFASRGTPMYPQGRYRLAMARALEESSGILLRVSEQSTPSRWTGERQLREIANLTRECEIRFWVNTRSRTLAKSPVMTRGDSIIAITAQIAVGFYALTLLRRARRRELQTSFTEAILGTCGLVALTSHFLAAFHYQHHWSHLAALDHTARRTAEVTGWNWSGGLYINYLFLAFWLGDAVRIWLEAARFKVPASPRWNRFVQLVFAFMMFNATVVFGPAHWIPISAAWGVCYLVLRLFSQGKTDRSSLNSTEPVSAPNR